MTPLETLLHEIRERADKFKAESPYKFCAMDCMSTDKAPGVSDEVHRRWREHGKLVKALELMLKGEGKTQVQFKDERKMRSYNVRVRDILRGEGEE